MAEHWFRIVWAPRDPGAWHRMAIDDPTRPAVCGFRWIAARDIETHAGPPVMDLGPLSRDRACRHCLTSGDAAA